MRQPTEEFPDVYVGETMPYPLAHGEPCKVVRAKKNGWLEIETILGRTWYVRSGEVLPAGAVEA